MAGGKRVPDVVSVTIPGSRCDQLAYPIEHPELWPEMGRAGRAHVEANYDIQKLNARLVEIYKELLHG